MNAPTIATAYIDPWSSLLYRDGLFDATNPLNRDDVFRPWTALKEAFEARGIECHTVDALLARSPYATPDRGMALYLSIGQRVHWSLLRSRPNVRLAAYWQMEPPCVDPAGYRQLPAIVKAFECVYTHWPESFGGRKLHWPQIRDGFLPALGDRGRRGICMINADKDPHPEFGIGPLFAEDSAHDRIPREGELYSFRRRALDVFGDVDLYGAGWERPNKGVVPDKFAVLRRYDFALCFENQRHPGYVTEKIFECMFAATVPIYLGAPDIADYVDPGCFVDVADFASLRAVRDFVATTDPEPHRQAMAGYFGSSKFIRFTPRHWASGVIGDLLGSRDIALTT